MLRKENTSYIFAPISISSTDLKVEKIFGNKKADRKLISWTIALILLKNILGKLLEKDSGYGDSLVTYSWLELVC